MPRKLITGSGATLDAARPLDVIALGLSGVGDALEVVIQISGATIAFGDQNTQPVALAAAQLLTYDKANLSQLYVRSNAPGVPGTVAVLGWKEE